MHARLLDGPLPVERDDAIRRGAGPVQLVQQVVEGMDRNSVDRDDPISRLQTGLRRRTAGDHLDLRRRRIGKSERRIEQDHDEERDEIVDARPGGDDEEASPRRLVGVRPRVGRILGGRLLRREPGDLAVPAEREGAEPVVRFAVPESRDAGAEADGERLHPHSEKTGEREVARFVGGDEQPQADDGDDDGKHGAGV